MFIQQTDLVPINPLIKDTDAVVGSGLPVGSGRSKAERLAELMRAPETFRQIGSAWFLYMHLVLVQGGRMVGTYDEVGLSMGATGKTVRNWVRHLESAGIAESQVKGHRVSICLVGKHIDLANAHDEAIQVMPPESTDFVPMSSEMRKATKLLQAAEEAGAPLELRTILSWKR